MGTMKLGFGYQIKFDYKSDHVHINVYPVTLVSLAQ